jgi:hypothetical protein
LLSAHATLNISEPGCLAATLEMFRYRIQQQ